MADRRRPRGRAPTARLTDNPVEVRADKLIGGGRALGHTDDTTWMLRGALPAELVRVAPTRRRAGIVEADVLEVVDDPHPARLASPCPHAAACGGCDWPHVDPGAGASLKRSVAAEAAARFPRLEARLRAAPITISPPAYRLRSRLHWDPREKALGFYGHRSWRVADSEHCRIITPGLAALRSGLVQALDSRCPQPVDIEIVEGDDGTVAALRPARSGPKSIPKDWVPGTDDCPALEGFHRLTGSSRLLRGWGRESVRMNLPVSLEVPVGSFFQANRHLVPWLFDTVAGLVGGGEEPVYDLHAGVGFLAAAARAAGRSDLTVVEVHGPAATAARHNLPGARVVPTTAEAFLASRADLPRDAVVITDPPRSGMTRELRAALAVWRPRTIVMLGCDPATWSRDTNDLMTHGYELIHLELVDLFPFTHHVEVLAVLETA